MRKLRTAVLICLLLFGIINLFVTFPVTPIAGEVPWKDQNISWYYDNLNDLDRQKIRQAMDHCIPREDIINEIHLGFATAIASPIGVNFVGVYEPTITAREYNTTKASILLEDVFGYSYDPNLAETNETTQLTSIPYFKITLIVPTTNTDRSQWAGITANSLNQVGIDARLIWWNWDIIMPRIFLDPIGTGLNYEQGGYDCFFVGYDASPDPEYKSYYDKNEFPTSNTNNNWFWIEDGPATSGIWTPTAYPNITALWTDIYAELDSTKRASMLKEYQQWYYDHVPSCIIRQEADLWGLDTNLEGFDLFHGIQQQICNWTGIGSSVTIAQPGDYVDFNPSISNSYYDQIFHSNTHVSLARRRGNYNLTHVYPWLAENWTCSTDLKTWTVNIRQGNKWSDGEDVDADDVVFSYHIVLNATTAAPGRGSLYNIIGNHTDSNGDYDCVKKGVNDYQVIFTLPEVYAYVETVLFNIAILPEHQMSIISPSNWRTHGTNWGSIPIAASGPYVLHDYDGTDTVELWVNPYYNETAMGHNPGALGGGNWIPNPTNVGHITDVIFQVVKSDIIAITGIITGVYDVIDSDMGIQPNFDVINDSAVCKVLTGYEWGYQQLGFNHYSPIWGMNPHITEPPPPSSSLPPISVYTTTINPSTSDLTPLDLIAIFLALLGIAELNVILRRRK